MKKSLLLISHSQKITDGLKEMIEQMNQSPSVEIHSLGGTSDGELGSDPTKLLDVVNQNTADWYFVFADIGSAVMSAEMGKEMLADDLQQKYILVDAPLVEGAFAAAITAGFSDDLDQILAEAKKAGQKGWD